ncbi:MAG: tRNA lysidine(34) synthetase TilS [Bacteroidales bacterium]|nr:tRNA lysidine(34) synthetase TilS [Bacteroidales bacterium]
MRCRTNIEEIVADFLESRKLPSDLHADDLHADDLHVDGLHAGGLLLAVSGGVDSSVMAHAIYALQKRCHESGTGVPVSSNVKAGSSTCALDGSSANASAGSLADASASNSYEGFARWIASSRIGVAHVNFHLRGADSNRDQEFVRNLAQRYGFEFFTVDFDTLAYAAEHKLSVEIAARELRYNWFCELAMKEGFKLLLTAHNANDNVETLLLNLVRGTGRQGLGAIRPYGPLSMNNAGEIFLYVGRPLLEVERSEIEEYARENNLEYCIDKTNSQNEYSRNKIRNQVIPLLKEINPSVIKTLSKDIERFRSLNTVLDGLCRDKLEELTSVQAVAEQTTPKQSSAEQSSAEQSSAEQASAEQFSAEQSSEVQPSSKQTVAKQISAVQIVSKQPVAVQPSSKQTVAKQISAVQIVSKQPVAVQPSAKKTAVEQAVIVQSTAVQSTEEQPSAKQPAARKSVVEALTERFVVCRVSVEKFKATGKPEFWLSELLRFHDIPLSEDAVENILTALSTADDTSLTIPMASHTATIERGELIIYDTSFKNLDFSSVQIESCGTFSYGPYSITLTETDAGTLHKLHPDVLHKRHAEVLAERTPDSLFVERSDDKRVDRFDVFRVIRNGFSVLDVAKVSFPLTLSTMQPGDRFSPFGLKGSKSVADFLNSRKVNLLFKDIIPVIKDKDGKIVCLPSLEIDDRFKVTSQSNKILIVSASLK